MCCEQMRTFCAYICHQTVCAEPHTISDIIGTTVMALLQFVQGNALSATGSASIVKALQAAPASREMVVRVPSRPASPAAASRRSSADVSVGNGDISKQEVMLAVFLRRTVHRLATEI